MRAGVVTVRAELADAIQTALYDPIGCDGICHGDALLAADAVLTVLGGVDGSVDPELLAAHLRADRGEIAHLRRTVKELRREIDGLSGLLDFAESERA